MAWKGTEGAVTTPHFTVKSYVIECEGDCAGITYKAPEFAYHAGRSRSYPLVTIRRGYSPNDRCPGRSPGLMERRSPGVRIHTWSNRLGDYGGGCRID